MPSSYGSSFLLQRMSYLSTDKQGRSLSRASVLSIPHAGVAT